MTCFEIMHVEDMEKIVESMGTGQEAHDAGMKNSSFYNYVRHIFESQILRRPARLSNALNRPPRQTIVRSPELYGI